MLPELKEIKLKRKQFGLTQSELAAKTGVSQSLITKIESGKLMPSYDNAKRLIDFLNTLHKELKLKAKDVMTKKVISVKKNASVKDAVRIMKKKAISQLPVMDNDKPVGTVSEKLVLERLHSTDDLNDLPKLRVEDVMYEAMPIIQENTPFDVLSNLLEHTEGILVARKGKIVGIVTKADILNVVLKNK